MKNDSKILITGGHGGLGIHLINEFKIQYPNLQLLAPTKKELDLTDYNNTKEYIENLTPTHIIHLASLVYGLQGNSNNQIKSLIVNTEINHNLFKALLQNPPEKIFFAGTVAAYGYPYQNMPLDETDFFVNLPHEGEFGYASAKKYAYNYLKLFNKNFGTKVIYGILTNLFGEYDRFDDINGHVIPSLIAKAHRASRSDLPFKVWGSGGATRDFMHFKDASRAIIHLLQENNCPDLINISSNIPKSISQVSEIISSVFKIENIIYEQSKPTGIVNRMVSNQILLDTGFQIKDDFENQIKNLANWYSENLDSIRKTST